MTSFRTSITLNKKQKRVTELKCITELSTLGLKQTFRCFLLIRLQQSTFRDLEWATTTRKQTALWAQATVDVEYNSHR